MVREGGVEPPMVAHQNLNLARLPIPPLSQNKLPAAININIGPRSVVSSIYYPTQRAEKLLTTKRMSEVLAIVNSQASLVSESNTADNRFFARPKGVTKIAQCCVAGHLKYTQYYCVSASCLGRFAKL